MSQWYYTHERQQQGPVSEMEIRQLISSGEIPDSALVWTEGMTDWQPVSSIEALAASPATPELPTQSPLPTSSGGTPAATPEATGGSSNPYAAPSADMAHSGGMPPTGFEGLEEIVPGSQPIDIGACIARTFELAKRNFSIILVMALVVFGISMGVSVVMSFVDELLGWGQTAPLPEMTGNPEMDEALEELANQGSLLSQLVNWVVSTFLGLGVVRVGLNLIAGQPVAISMLFSQGGKTLRALVAGILFGLMVGLGLLLLIFPGIYLAARFGQYKNAIVDKDLGIFESFSYSSRITEGNKLPLTGLFIILLLIAMAGFLLLCFGLFFTVPFYHLGLIVAYRWMQYGAIAAQER